MNLKISILNTWSGDKWSSCQTINSVLLTLCSLLNDSPLENEPGQSKSSSDFIPYQKSIEFKNIDHINTQEINVSKPDYSKFTIWHHIDETYNESWGFDKKSSGCYIYGLYENDPPKGNANFLDSNVFAIKAGKK